MTTKHIDELLVLQLKAIADDVTRAITAISKDGDYQMALGCLGGSPKVLVDIETTLLMLRASEYRLQAFYSNLKPTVRTRFDTYVKTQREDMLLALSPRWHKHLAPVDLDEEWRNFVADGNIDAEGNLVP